MMEIRCFNNKRVPFPVTTRIAEPEADVLGQMRTPVEGNDANVIVRLQDQNDITRRLQDLGLAVMIKRKSRRPLIPGDAARIEVVQGLHADLRVSRARRPAASAPPASEREFVRPPDPQPATCAG